MINLSSITYSLLFLIIYTPILLPSLSAWKIVKDYSDFQRSLTCDRCLGRPWTLVMTPYMVPPWGFLHCVSWHIKRNLPWFRMDGVCYIHYWKIIWDRQIWTSGQYSSHWYRIQFLSTWLRRKLWSSAYGGTSRGVSGRGVVGAVGYLPIRKIGGSRGGNNR